MIIAADKNWQIFMSHARYVLDDVRGKQCAGSDKIDTATDDETAARPM